VNPTPTGAARRKPLCGGCNTSLSQGAPPGSHARQQSSKEAPHRSSRTREVDENTDNRWARVHPPKYNDIKDLQGPTSDWEEVTAEAVSMHIFRRLRRKSESTPTNPPGPKTAGVRYGHHSAKLALGLDREPFVQSAHPRAHAHMLISVLWNVQAGAGWQGGVCGQARAL
jgi:hypothetical protein